MVNPFEIEINLDKFEINFDEVDDEEECDCDYPHQTDTLQDQFIEKCFCYPWCNHLTNLYQKLRQGLLFAQFQVEHYEKFGFYPER